MQKYVVHVSIPGWLQRLNRNVLGFTARIEPLCCKESAANLGIHVCIVMSGNVCHILSVVLLCLLLQPISVLTQCTCRHLLVQNQHIEKDLNQSKFLATHTNTASAEAAL